MTQIAETAWRVVIGIMFGVLLTIFMVSIVSAYRDIYGWIM